MDNMYYWIYNRNLSTTIYNCIPYNEIIVDLDNTEINTSLKISSVKLPEGVKPTITDRDFVIGTVVAPTVLVEPEKVEETVAEGEVPAEGAEGTPAAEEGKPSDEKTKAAPTETGKTEKSSDDKGKVASGDKGKAQSKESKKK